MTNSTPDAVLSTYYSTSEYRLGGEHTVARWTRLTKPAARSHCDECARLQHETAGTFGPRRQPRFRRTIARGPRLALCSRHAEAWRERDRADVPAAPRGSHHASYQEATR